MFSVNNKIFKIGCTARFEGIKEEKIVIATSGEKTIAHACSGKTWVPARTRAPIGECVLPSSSGIGAKTQLCKGCQGTATISQHFFFFVCFFFCLFVFFQLSSPNTIYRL